MLVDVFDRVEEKALQKGIQKGIQKDRKEVAKRMLDSGIDMPIIVKVTGLKKTEILQLKRKNGKNSRN